MSFTSLFAAPPTHRQDRRSARRRRPEQLVYADFGPNNGGIVIDLCETGLQFQSVERIMLGDHLPVSFVLTGSVTAIKTTAEVVWCNDTGKGGGLKLLELPKTVRHEISAWVSSDPLPATSTEASARGIERASFNLLTAEGRITSDPLSDEAAMAMARLLVSARGSAKLDAEPEATLSAYDEAAPAIVPPAAPFEPEAQTEPPAAAQAVAEAIPEATEPPAELAEQNPDPVKDAVEHFVEHPAEQTIEHAVETPAEASAEPIAATETLVDLSAGEAFAELAQESLAVPDAAAVELTVVEAPTPEVPIEVGSETTIEVTSEAASEVIAAAEAVAEAPSELAVSADEHVDSPLTPDPVAHTDAFLAENVATDIAPAIISEAAAAPPIPEESSDAEAISEAIEAAPATETAPPPVPVDVAPAATVASEEPVTALLEILLSAAETAPVAPPPAPSPVTAPAVAEAAPAHPPISAAPRAEKTKDARIPAAHVSVPPAKSDGPNQQGKGEKTAATIHGSMWRSSILGDPSASPVAVPASVPAKSKTVHLPGWGAQVLKFAAGVGVGCCLVAGAFVGAILLSPGHRAFSFARRHVDTVAEASAPTVAPTLDVEVIDLNSRRWHLNDTAQDATPFAPQNPVVELTPDDSHTAAGVSTPGVSAGKLPTPKLHAGVSPVPRTPKIPAISSNPVAAATPPASATPEPTAKSDASNLLALPSPLVTHGAGNSTDVGAPTITETISSSISSAMDSAARESSAPADPRTPVSSNPVFPSALLLPPAHRNANFHIAVPIRQVNPTYSPLARQLQLSGTVRIDAFVGKDGRAHSLRVISGNPLLSSATLAAVSDWTFRPAQLDGESVESEITISVSFQRQ